MNTVSPYVPLLGLMALAAVFMVGAIVASGHIGPQRYNRSKYDSFECGVEATPAPVGGGRFDVKYYVTAMLFIVFDIEVVFLFPWAVAFDKLGTFAVVEMGIFIVVVFAVYLYVLRRGGLDWD